MISRCPSCGAPAPDEAKQCPACDWDFVGNKKSSKNDPAKKAEPAGLSLPPARPAPADAPASELGMARLPKIEHVKSDATAEAADSNPFALPVARNLAPKPGKDLFSVPPPPAQKPDVKPPAPVVPASVVPAPAVEPPAPDEPPQKAGLAVEAAQPPRPELIPVKAAKAVDAPPKPASKTGAPAGGEAKAPARSTAVYLAAAAGGALGLLSIGAIYLALRPDPLAAGRTATAGSSPFGKRTSGETTPKPVVEEAAEPARADVPAPVPAPTVPAPVLPKASEPSKPVTPTPASAPSPAPLPPAQDPSRPTATFALPARVKPPSPQPAAAPAARRAAPKKTVGPRWEFEGVVYDLLTARGVFGVQLVFVDGDDNQIAAVGTDKDGHYRVEMKAGPPEGYALRIVHEDYSGKHIDELDSTSSVRKADLDDRKFLMKAGVRNVAWIGATDKTTHRDMALVPKAGE